MTESVIEETTASELDIFSSGLMGKNTNSILPLEGMDLSKSEGQRKEEYYYTVQEAMAKFHLTRDAVFPCTSRVASIRIKVLKFFRCDRFTSIQKICGRNYAAFSYLYSPMVSFNNLISDMTMSEINLNCLQKRKSA